MKISSRFLIAGVLLIIASTAGANERVSSDGLWQDVSEEAALSAGTGQRVLFPRVFRLVALDLHGLRSLVAGAPLEFTPEAVSASPVLTLPMPDGSFASFYVQQSPIMQPALAAKLPEVRTYRAEGIDDPEATARLDVTPEGFHGFILSAKGTVYIDPFRKGDTTHYMSYWRSDYGRPEGVAPFRCEFVSPSGAAPVKSVESTARPSRPARLTANGGTLRTYRLALAATGEYTEFHGGTVVGAQAGIVTTMNRINGIYEAEVAVRMTLVDNTAIVFTDPDDDPYANTSGDLDNNQETIDDLIGDENYDIGHLFGTGGGGIAGLGVVCLSGEKAVGLTGSGSPIGDAFDIDYVAHEMGHQFGANHTFNGTAGACGGGNREDAAAYEPGSGSTIMAYAGICSSQNLQSNSDAYFHTKSFDEIFDFITGDGDSCPVQSSTGNTPPTVDAGLSITIPRSTPFYLTGSGSDVDPDSLTYCWEEFDLSTGFPPNDVNPPLFRSFNPVTSPIRTFPKLSDLLDNTTTIGESLPATTRVMNFRLTARDNVDGVNYDTTTVSVISTAGPFVVTAPNSGGLWGGGTTQTVTWNEAGTSAPPVSCANVKVLLSSDGGTTFATTLLASTPNDGSESVILPNVAAATARMRVECVTSPFFDISNVNFSITESAIVVAAATTSTSVSLNWASITGAASYEVYRNAGAGFSLLGTTATTNFDDNTAAAGTAYLYAVKWLDAMSTPSALGPPDLATTVELTDGMLTPAATIVQAAHITELRTAVNAVRTLAGLSPFSFTDPTITAGLTIAKTAHITELRTALDAARSALSLASVTYTDSTLTAQSTLIKAAHIGDVRDGVE